MADYLFYIFSFITVLTVLLMIFQKNPLASALLLILGFFSLAALYILLHAPFIAALQILVYAGAIMVLFVFVIMLLNLKKTVSPPDTGWIKKTLIFLVGSVLFLFFVFAFFCIPETLFPAVSEGFGSPEKIGELLFSKYIIAFELIDILLLAGIVGAVLLGKKET